jgi:hypothetical protein
VSSHSFNEVWIIDHSTTLLKAKVTPGGNTGNGGDLIYRWEIPWLITLEPRHNCWTYVRIGLSQVPFENQIMIFNNGNGRTGGNYSTIEIIKPPVNGYIIILKIITIRPQHNFIRLIRKSNAIYAQNTGANSYLMERALQWPSRIFTEVNLMAPRFGNPVIH